MVLFKDFTAFFFNSCETIHIMNILGGGISYLEPKGKELSQVFFCCCCKTIKMVLNLLFGVTGARFTAGLVKVPRTVFSLHERAMPSEPVKTSNT